MKIPMSIVRYIRSVWVTKLFFSYLRLDVDYTLIESSGYLQHYGLSNLVIGQSAIQQIDFLIGLLPIQQVQVLEFLQLHNGHSAHIHVIPSQDEIWILLFDATVEYEQKQAFRQRTNELVLLLNEQNQRIQQLEYAQTLLLEEKCKLERMLNAVYMKHSS